MGAMGRPLRNDGNLIRRARLKAGLTQAELATRAGVTKNSVSDAEVRSNPSLAVLARYGEALGCTLVVLYVTGDGETIR